MNRVAWLTDIHLSFVAEEHRQQFVDQILNAKPDTLLIGGDIGEANNVVAFLKNIADVFQTPTYFVLGNHDFYGGSIAGVRAKVSELCMGHPFLTFLTTQSQPVQLAPGVGLVGHDGWADAREGDYAGSRVMMNDYRLIEELANCNKADREHELRRLGDEAAQHIRDQLNAAIRVHRTVYLLTHVPPFRAACWYQGRTTDDEWAPHFVCQTMGRAILEVARGDPEKQITVLCGHTHNPGECQPAPNVRVITGGAEYGYPSITQIFEVA